MKIGISIPQMDAPQQLLEWARRTDTGPFSSLGILDRLVYSNYEPLIALTMAAAVTTRVRLLTEVLISPLRNTAILAKESATLDVLSNGRLTLGLGIGSREDDFLAAQVEHTNRGKYFNKQLSMMKHIWSGQALSNEVGPIGPRPLQPGGPELILGGHSLPAMKRAAQYGNGFISGTDNADQTNWLFCMAREAWQDAGRVEKPRLIGQVNLALETYDIELARKKIYEYYIFTGHLSSTKANSMISTKFGVEESIKAFDDIGADELIFYIWSPQIDQVDRLADIIS